MTYHPPGTEAREVTLLPRHWAWLMAQPRSPGATLRQLIQEARLDKGGRLRLRESQEACYVFLRCSAGDRPHFESAIRALFASDQRGFDDAIASWPLYVRQQASNLASTIWLTHSSRSA